jgi:type IV secretion system protein VirB3
MVFTMEAFLLTKNLMTLPLCAPIHGVCMLLCARDARFFDLVLLWARTRLPALFSNLRVWKASSYSPLLLDLPNRRGRRRAEIPQIQVMAPRAGNSTIGTSGSRSYGRAGQATITASSPAIVGEAAR